MTFPYRLLCIATVLCAACLPGTGHAQGFSALVSPPRIEASATAGSTYRDVIEISHIADKAGHYTVKTNDWAFMPDNSVQFSEALAPGSCRPWVGLEATELRMAPNGKRRYRFEIAVPADAPAGECRFAIMIEGEPESAAGSVALPVSGRIGVIVYLRVGDTAPKLEIAGQSVKDMDGRRLPVLAIRNAGNAHGRLQGLVDGVDASGRKYAFAPATLPIMPGTTHDIALTPQGDNEDAPPPVLVYPVRLQGHLENDGQRLDIDTFVAQ